MVISTATFGQGTGGSLAVRASDSVELSGTSADSDKGSGLFTAVQPGATGAGGNLTLSTGRLILRGGAVVSAATLGAGAAGTLLVSASDSVELIGTSADNQYSSRLSARSTDSADAGDLRILTGLLRVQDGAQVTVSSEGSGDAGNLEVQANSVFLDNNGQLIARTASGNGGNIALDVRDLLLQRHNSQIATDASGGTGNGGNIDINGQFIVAVPNENRTQHSAIPSPQGAVSIKLDLSLTAASSNPSAPLVEATGWVRDSKGEVILTAQPPTVTSHSSWMTPAKCNGR